MCGEGVLIFVTVGEQLPFDRLISCVDRWAIATNRSEVFAQVGMSQYRARAIETVPFLPPDEFRMRVQAARAIVAHAGIGTILAALEQSRPIIVMPRSARLGEHRNDHQLATARRFAEAGYVRAALDESELIDALEAVDSQPTPPRISPSAEKALLARIRLFLDAVALRGRA